MAGFLGWPWLHFSFRVKLNQAMYNIKVEQQEENMAKRYNVTDLEEITIGNDGREVRVETSVDNRGDTLVMFGASFNLRVDVEDLETLIETLTTAFNIHKQQAIDEHNRETQPQLPFDEENSKWDLNDPRNW